MLLRSNKNLIASKQMSLPDSLAEIPANTSNSFKLLKTAINQFSGIISSCHGGIIGYKGGIICKIILDSLNIPSISVD